MVTYLSPSDGFPTPRGIGNGYIIFTLWSRKWGESESGFITFAFSSAPKAWKKTT